MDLMDSSVIFTSGEICNAGLYVWKSLYTLIRICLEKNLDQKVKGTLSLRKDVVRRVKSKLAIEGRSLSDAVKEFLPTVMNSIFSINSVKA